MVFAVNTASERANSVTSFCSFSMYIIYEVKDSLYEQRYQSMFIGLAWGNKRLTWDLRCQSSRCPTGGIHQGNTLSLLFQFYRCLHDIVAAKMCLYRKTLGPITLLYISTSVQRRGQITQRESFKESHSTYRCFFSYNDVQIDVSVDEMTILIPANCSLYSHQTMLLGEK